ncbi:MAG TPA: TOBE domain-containing protein, partial [Stellaceae bacterium]|nr:TOBE domain-containing protein [Stellaceae bacterium]
ALGGGVRLKVAGPPLRPGTPVGWGVRPGGIRLAAGGAYHGCVASLLRAGMSHHLTIGVGDVRIKLLANGDNYAVGTSCRLDIDPAAVQVWPR